MRQPAPGYVHAIRVIDRIVLWSGYVSALLVVPLVVANTVEVFIARLRRKLGANLIVTVRGLGYRIGDHA